MDISNYFLICNFEKAAFRDERLVEFTAQNGPKHYSDPDNPGRYGLLTWTGNLRVNKNGRYAPPEKEQGEGFVRCPHIKFMENGTARVGISDNLKHGLSFFVVPQDSLQIIEQ